MSEKPFGDPDVQPDPEDTDDDDADGCLHGIPWDEDCCDCEDEESQLGE